MTKKITNKISVLLKKVALFKLLSYPVLAMFLTLSTLNIAEAKSLSEQRTEYRAAIKADDKKRYLEFKRLKADLQDYPLYPYLDYREFVRDLSGASLSRVKRFEERYQDMPFTRTLRARYLTLLGKRRDWRTFLAYQKEPPRDETLRCYYFHAKAQRGYRVEALKGAKEMYLTGKSVSRACDSLFSYLRKSGELTDELILKRALLAFESRNPGLINYLSRQVSGENQAMVQSALRLYKAPTRVEHFAQISKITVFHQDLVSLALIKLARKNPDEAVRQFANTMKGQKVPESLRQEVGDYIAGRLMSTDDTSLRVWRDNVLNKSSDVKLLERRFRLAIAQGRFESAERWIDQLPDAEVDNLKWRYWKARIAKERGHHFAANQHFEDISGQRNFYSIAASIHLGKPPLIPYTDPDFDANSLFDLQQPLARVRELLALNKMTAAKREWDFLLRRVSVEQIEKLAAYASEKKWHHLAVQATIRGKLWDHIPYRFPIAHLGWFDMFSKKRQLPLPTLLALSRQESAFHTQAVSPVGARGLMQLMPATARATSKKLGIHYRGKHSLTDPVTNIRLGSGYLRELLDKYDDNRVLALAAYNAGPSRVKRWLNETNGNLDAIAFIEAIPFRETRGYVQNVLVFEMYYRELLGKPQHFLQPHESKMRY